MDTPHVAGTAGPQDAEIAALRQEGQRLLDTDAPAAERIAVFTRWAALAPNDPQPLRERAWAHLWAGDKAAAQADAALALAFFPEDAQLAAAMGRIYAELEMFDEAEHAFDRAAARSGDDTDLLELLAAEYEAYEFYAKALAMYERLRDRRPRPALLGSARMRDALEDAAGALADVAAALAAPPTSTDAEEAALEDSALWSMRAGLLRELHDLDAAETAARTALDLAGDSLAGAEPATTLAEIMLDRGDKPAAQALAEAAVARYPAYLSAWMTLIRTHGSGTNMGLMLDIVHRAMEHHPTNHNLALVATMLRGFAQDGDGIVAEWDRLVAAAPHDAAARAMRGAILLERGRLEEARADVNLALRLDPENAHGLETRVKLLLAGQDGPGALAAAEHALRQDPASPHLLVLRAEAHMLRGDALASLADYARVLEIDPQSYEAHQGMGHVQMVLGAYDRALHNYRAALGLMPDSATALYNIADALAMQGHCAQAVDHLRRAIAAEPALATDAAADEFLDTCRHLPSFAAALRGSAPAPARGGKAPGPPPRGARKKRK